MHMNTTVFITPLSTGCVLMFLLVIRVFMVELGNEVGINYEVGGAPRSV